MECVIELNDLIRRLIRRMILCLHFHWYITARRILSPLGAFPIEITTSSRKP